jgi:uncharacterized membrane protein YgdD (TMEM256/DUF423 family)
VTTAEVAHRDDPVIEGRAGLNYAVAGSLSALVAVAAGAFGAHALRDRLEPRMLVVFETAARYQMYHVVGLFAAAWFLSGGHCPPARWAARLFLAGTVIFSGSLYALALTGVHHYGMITPIGGIAFLAGWICLAYAARRG